jgi:biotin carboxylase
LNQVLLVKGEELMAEAMDDSAEYEEISIGRPQKVVVELTCSACRRHIKVFAELPETHLTDKERQEVQYAARNFHDNLTCPKRRGAR